MQRRDFLKRSGATMLGLWLGSGCGSETAVVPNLPGSSLPWEALSRLLQGPLLLPGAPDFNRVVAPWNLRYAAQKPAGVARCQSVADVQACLAWAQSNGVPLVARSGGHSYAGYSLTPGLMIDVSPMNQVGPVAPDGRARLGGGSRNANVYAALREPSVAVTHGRCKQVGVGGLVLGGGIGFNMRLHGLTCDGLVETEMVTADGRVLTCNAQQNSDLFWACRGAGGGNFGIHTSFTFQTFPVTQLTIFHLKWRSRHRQVLGALNEVMPTTPRELGCKVSLAAAPDGSLEVRLLGQLLGTPAQLDTLLAPVLTTATPDSSQIEVRPYWDAQEFLSDEGAPGFSHERSHYVFGELSEAALDTVVDFMLRWPGTSVSADWKFFLMGGAVSEVASGATAYVHRQATMVSSAELEWSAQDSAKTIAENQAWLNDFHSAMRSLTSGSSYQNFIDADEPDYLRSYYGANLERLVSVKAQVDPKNVFHYPQSIPVRL
jgi:FAD/FMN-containing dehydrogenase